MPKMAKMTKEKYDQLDPFAQGYAAYWFAVPGGVDNEIDEELKHLENPYPSMDNFEKRREWERGQTLAAKAHARRQDENDR